MTETHHKILMAGLLVLALLVGLLMRRYGERMRPWGLMLVDLFPMAWTGAFTWCLVHMVSELIPARKHPTFADNAVASAWGMAFLVALVPRKWRGVGAGVMTAIVSFLGLADILHMRIFGNVIPIGSAGSATQLWDIRDSILSLFESQDIWAGVAMLAGVTFAVAYRVPELKARRAVRVAAYVVPALCLSYSIIPLHRDVSTFLESKWAKEVLNREDQVWNAGFLQAHVREASLAIKLSLEARDLTEKERKEVASFFRERSLATNTKGLAGYGIAKGKNVLILQIEAIEEWLIGASVRGQAITPFLNELREESFYYENMFDQVASSSTADCEYLVLNSNHPLSEGAVAFRREENRFVTVPTILKDAGYATVSMHGYRRGMWNRATLHPRYGFERSYFAEELGEKPAIGWGLDDRAFFKQLIETAEDLPEPYLIFAITLSSHHPYSYIPYRDRRLRLGGLEGTMVGNYIHSAAFVDDALKVFFRDLEAKGLLEELVVIAYGDHDGHLRAGPRARGQIEALLENVTDMEKKHIGAGTWALDRIPLFVRVPGAKGGTVRAYGGQIDFGPTLLHFLGVERPASFMGRAIIEGDVVGAAVRWDRAVVRPPFIYDSVTQCRRLGDLAPANMAACEPLIAHARAELDASWRMTNNDLASWLVEKAKPLPKAKAGTTRRWPLGPLEPGAPGAGCTEDTGCGPYDGLCIGGTCVAIPASECTAPGSAEGCPEGTRCWPAEGVDLPLCWADCDFFPCAGTCNEVGLCAP